MKNLFTLLLVTLIVSNLHSQQLAKPNIKYKWTYLSGDGITNPFIFKSDNDYVSIPLTDERWVPMGGTNEGVIQYFAVYNPDFSSISSVIQYKLNVKESRKMDVNLSKDTKFVISTLSSERLYFIDDASNSNSIKEIDFRTNSLKEYFKLPNAPIGENRLIGSFMNYLIIGNSSTGKFDIYDVDSKKNIRTLTISNSNHTSNNTNFETISFDENYVFWSRFNETFSKKNISIFDLTQNKVLFSGEVSTLNMPLIASENIYWLQNRANVLSDIETIPFPKLPDMAMNACFNKDEYIFNDFFKCSYDIDSEICCLHFSKGTKFSNEEFSDFKNYFELVLAKREEILKSNENALKFIGDGHNIYVSVLPKIDGVYLTKKQKEWFDLKLIESRKQMDEVMVHNNNLKNNLKNTQGIALYTTSDGKSPLYYFENALMIYGSDDKEIIIVKYLNGTEKKFSLSTMKFLESNKTDF